MTHIPELDRRKKAGARLSAPDDDAWREWKSVSLGPLTGSEDEQEEEEEETQEEAAQILSCSRSSHLETWTLFLLPRSLLRLSALVSAQHLVRQWIHFMRQALWCSGSCRAHRRQRQWYGLLALLVLMYFALCSLRLSAGFFGGRCHARRRQQQWHVRGWFCWFVAPLAVFFCFR